MSKITWVTHKQIEEIESFVNEHLTHEEIEEYYRTFGEVYEDWVDEIGDWLGSKINVLQGIQELVYALPDDMEMGNNE